MKSKLELLYSCVPKLELGNKVEKNRNSFHGAAFSFGRDVSALFLWERRPRRDEIEAGASAQLCSQAGAWEQGGKRLTKAKKSPSPLMGEGWGEGEKIYVNEPATRKTGDAAAALFARGPHARRR